MRYRAGIRHIGDVDGDGRADFAVRDANSGDPFVAFGPSNVGGGLSLDLSIASASGQINLPGIGELFFDEGNRLARFDHEWD